MRLSLQENFATSLIVTIVSCPVTTGISQPLWGRSRPLGLASFTVLCVGLISVCMRMVAFLSGSRSKLLYLCVGDRSVGSASSALRPLCCRCRVGCRGGALGPPCGSAPSGGGPFLGCGVNLRPCKAVPYCCRSCSKSAIVRW